MDLKAFQDTIQGLAKQASGLQCIWAKQTRKRPVRPFVELDDLDNDDVSMMTDDSITNTPSPTPGHEITLTAKGQAEITVQVRVFSSEITGSSNAFNIAQAIRSFFARESATAGLGSIALVERGTVRDVTLVLETEYEGRAVFNLKFRVADPDVETTTYIEHATVQTTVAQTTGDVTTTDTIPP